MMASMTLRSRAAAARGAARPAGRAARRAARAPLPAARAPVVAAAADAAGAGAAGDDASNKPARRTGDFIIGKGPEEEKEAEKLPFLAMCLNKFCFMLQLPEPLKKFTLPCQIAMWFSMYMVYNLISKQLLNVLPAPMSLHSAFNLICVTCSMLTLAAVETARGNGMKLKELVSVDAGRAWRQGVLHATTHAASMAAIGGASLCYAHTAKASEPIFSALLAVFVFGKKLSLKIWMSLLPIVGGVAWASMGKGGGGIDAQVAYALTAALICSSTLAFHQASIKGSLKDEAGATPVAGSPLRVYARALLLAAPVAFGFAVAMESSMWANAPAMLASAATAMGGTNVLAGAVLLGGVSFFLYNQLALICLDSLTPLSSSIGNVMKRVFVVAVSVTLMGGAVTDQQLQGFGLAMVGVAAYSLASKSAPSQDKADPPAAKPATVAA